MRKYIYIIFCSILFFACKKEDINPGIIIRELELSNCILLDVTNQEYVIESDSTYQLLLFNKPFCESYTLPFIDFANYTLLGNYATGKCKVDFQPQVLREETTKQYNYTVYVCDKGLCKSQAMSMNWVLVPKLPENWTVKFDVIEK